MNLDTNTLYLVTIYVEAILGLLLLFAAVQNSDIRAVGWWGFAHLLLAISLGMFGTQGSLHDAISVDLAHMTLVLAFGVIWSGARVFDGRKPLVYLVIAGPVLWFAVAHQFGNVTSFDLSFLTACLLIASYNWLTAYEFWRGRVEALVSRWPAIFMSCAYGSLFLLCAPLVNLLPWDTTNHAFESVWLVVLSFQALLFSIATAFILLAMAKERTELRHKIAAMIDPLTGIANRRSFLMEAEKMRQRLSTSKRPFAVLVIDLDQFKGVNDRFGHAVGDCVLRQFAKTSTSALRSGDLIGRIGGEEFACVLNDTDFEAAFTIAERLRCGFAEAAVSIDGYNVNATVSIGLVAGRDAAFDMAFDMAELIALADRALYRAKERGRNRVEVAVADQQRRRKIPPTHDLVAQARSAA
jgi:diguanylate cyclase (GGDEF)-like protein